MGLSLVIHKSESRGNDPLGATGCKAQNGAGVTEADGPQPCLPPPHPTPSSRRRGAPGPEEGRSLSTQGRPPAHPHPRHDGCPLSPSRRRLPASREVPLHHRGAALVGSSCLPLFTALKQWWVNAEVLVTKLNLDSESRITQSSFLESSLGLEMTKSMSWGLK